jgi:Txe/YoeB family toxin of Txe-Axe toxin-antitoxin module
VDGRKKDGHGSWTGWSRRVVKNERFTVYLMDNDMTEKEILDVL